MGAVGEVGVGPRGEAQACPSAGFAESIRHWKEATPEPPGSAPENSKQAPALLVSAGGLESIWVVGAVVSTLQLNEAGLWSALPALSIARTSNLWAPSASPE